ncbi:hypothetical protein GGX14DRAFT_661513 [Mycena pura]|uniref:F-box domain-containing protein n=1 Tax=Mycena pura TaxID=153505 RepID=A0AAD6V4H2_9AGAR|nr:hypothetical protein GGX14DRAFT_661513 [Mycena pura]
MTSFSGDAFAEHMKAAAVQRDSYTTPAPTARKRTRHERNSSASTAPSEDKRDEMPANPLVALNTSRPATRNAAIAVKSFVKKQKLCGEQLIQLDSFLNDTPTIQEGKIFTLLLSLQNNVCCHLLSHATHSLVTQTNIQSYTDVVETRCLKNSSSRTRTLHGAVDITYQVTNDVQQEVDDLIDAASTDSASTPTSEDGPRPSEAANGLAKRTCGFVVVPRFTINAPLYGSRLPAGIWSLIKSLSAQWGRLELTIPAPDFLELCEIAGPFPHLQVVALNSDRYGNEHAEFRAPFLHAPKLQVLCLSNAFIDCFERELGERSQSTLAVRFPIHRSATEIFRMFKKFPNLRHLIVSTIHLIDDLPPQLSAPCPPLRSLVLYDCAFVLKYLTLPTLENLEIMFPNGGYGQLILDFVARSSCTLTFLGLEFFNDDSELECALRAAPSVASLRLSFDSTPQNACFVLRRLDILPHLKNIHVRVWSADNVDIWDMFLGLVQARPALLVADFCEISGRVPLPTAQQIAGFKAAVDRGMRITLRMNHDEPWQWPDGPEEDMDETFRSGFRAGGSLSYVWNYYPPIV